MKQAAILSGSDSAPKAADLKMVAFVLIAICFQDIRIVDFGSFGLKPFHLIAVFVVVYSVAKRKSEWELPGKLFICGLLVMLGISLVDYLNYGFRSEFLNYLFMYFICAGLYNLGRDYSIEDWRWAIQRAALFVMVAIYIKLAVNFDAILTYFRHTWGNHPIIPTFLGGGVNLEASWMALFIVFFKKDVKGYLYTAMAFILSMVYASRAGMIISVIAALYLLVLSGVKRSVGIKIIIFSAAVLVIFAYLAASGNVLATRFLETGTETGSVARLTMWGYAGLAFAEAPLLGCGAGNATTLMSQLGGVTILETNVHLYALQVLLDFGIVGFAIFATIVATFLCDCRRTKLSSPFSAWILIYLIASFIQFRGGDVLLGVALAGYFQTRSGPIRRSSEASSQRRRSWLGWSRLYDLPHYLLPLHLAGLLWRRMSWFFAYPSRELRIALTLHPCGIQGCYGRNRHVGVCPLDLQCGIQYAADTLYGAIRGVFSTWVQPFHMGARKHQLIRILPGCHGGFLRCAMLPCYEALFAGR